jgi:hypothetical protein
VQDPEVEVEVVQDPETEVEVDTAPDTEVEIDLPEDEEPPEDEDDEDVPPEDEDDVPPILEEEEPTFECPDGFRKVQMANGGFTCVPNMVRPRVGPYTQTIDVSPLAGRTPYRPGARRP